MGRLKPPPIVDAAAMAAEARDPKTPLPRRLQLIAAISFPRAPAGSQNGDFQQALLEAAHELRHR